MKVIPGMCSLNYFVFIDFPVFIPWTHQMKVIPGMYSAKLDSYVFIDFPVFITLGAPDEGYSKDV